MILIRSIAVYLYTSFYCFDYVFGNPIDRNFQLQVVQVLFRHGARTPLAINIQILPQYNDSVLFQPWGFAQLTKDGMIQEYEIGKMLRKRYDGFLSDLYIAEELYAYSSNTERTIASLQLVLAALYRPVAEQKWHDELPWIPIPIHTIPRTLDILMNSKSCPAYAEKLQEVFNSNDIKFSPHNLTVQQISGILGRPVGYAEIFGLYTILKIIKSSNIPLPQWYTDEVFRNTLDTADFYLNILSHTNTLKRLNGGPLLRRFLENMMNSNANAGIKKLYLYSAHELSLHAYLRSHNLITFGIPDYGSVILVEKYRSIENQYYVKLLYWTGEPRQMHVLKLENCSEMCPLEKYSEIIRSSLPSDDEMLCLLKNLNTNDLNEILYADYVK